MTALVRERDSKSERWYKRENESEMDTKIEILSDKKIRTGKRKQRKADQKFETES